MFAKFSCVLGAVLIAAPLIADEPTEIDSPVSRIYVPQGFDDNDNVEVILQGVFRDSCYRIGHTQSKVDLQKRLITVYATAYRYPVNAACAEMLTPFIQVVKVGLLASGTYKVVYGHQPSINHSIYVAPRASEGPDDYLYAPVDYADVYTDARTSESVLELHGTYPKMLIGCAVLREIRLIPSLDNMLVVLPIMEAIDGPECIDQPHHFRRLYPLGEMLTGTTLVHVRVISGNSINRYVEVHER